MNFIEIIINIIYKLYEKLLNIMAKLNSYKFKNNILYDLLDNSPIKIVIYAGAEYRKEINDIWGLRVDTTLTPFSL